MDLLTWFGQGHHPGELSPGWSQGTRGGVEEPTTKETSRVIIPGPSQPVTRHHGNQEGTQRLSQPSHLIMSLQRGGNGCF